MPENHDIALYAERLRAAIDVDIDVPGMDREIDRAHGIEAAARDLLRALVDEQRIGESEFYVEVPGWGQVRVRHASDAGHAAELAVDYVRRCQRKGAAVVEGVEVYDAEGNGPLAVCTVTHRSLDVFGWPGKLSDITVRLIGTAAPDTQPGVICASYNAG